MPRNSWNIVKQDAALILARRLPVRFDLSVSTWLPQGARLRVAHQVRQDVWRALQTLRGYSPAVRVKRSGTGLQVTAGGQVDGVFPRAWAEARLANVLDDPENRARWVRWST